LIASRRPRFERQWRIVAYEIDLLPRIELIRF